MLHRPRGSPPANWRRLLALSCLSVLVLNASGFLLYSELPAQEDGQVALSDLNQVLKATRAQLVTAATELREELETLKQKNEDLAAKLHEEETRRTELESSRKAAEARIAEFSEALDVAIRKAAGVNDENARLKNSLAQANSAHEAMQTEAKKTRADMEAQLNAVTDAVEQSRAELAELGEEFVATRQQLATAKSAREQSVAQLGEMRELSSGRALKRSA
jgi:chromosome segregation ATPase